VLAGVRSLLHQQGYTIKGVQRLHKEYGVRRLMAAAGGDAEALSVLEAERGLEPDMAEDAAPMAMSDERRVRLRAVLGELEQAKARIDALLQPDPNS
jgi:hypothetical protein